MNIAPGATYEAVIDWGVTGLTGTLGLRVIDNAGATTVARLTTLITEQPAGSGVYVRTANVAPSVSGQYTLVWDDGSTTPGHVATEDLTITSSAPGEAPVGDTYATTTELARILKIRTPTADQTTAMERVLLTATGEINSEIDLDDDTVLAGWQVALVTEVCLERAVEHWQQMESPFGIIGLGAEFGGTHTATDSWNRHANKLAPLKEQWGVA